MKNNLKYLVGVILDLCNAFGFTYEYERFALSFSSHLLEAYEKKQITRDLLLSSLSNFKNFIIGNDVPVERFADSILLSLKIAMEYNPKSKEFIGYIFEFKKEVEGVLYSAFRVSDKPQEETGRTLLQAYLHPKGFRESQMSGGNCDLIYPSEDTIIETKIWRDLARYHEGIVELCAYLKAQGYVVGYYVLFDNTQGVNVVVKEKGSEIFDITYDNFLIHVIFIKINPVAPSKKLRKLVEDTK